MRIVQNKTVLIHVTLGVEHSETVIVMFCTFPPVRGKCESQSAPLRELELIFLHELLLLEIKSENVNSNITTD